jgi:hypothetical protein
VRSLAQAEGRKAKNEFCRGKTRVREGRGQKEKSKTKAKR